MLMWGKKADLGKGPFTAGVIQKAPHRFLQIFTDLNAATCSLSRAHAQSPQTTQTFLINERGRMDSR